MNQPTIKFTLHLTIEGTSLDEIDAGLTQAATARLLARKPHLKESAGVDPIPHAPTGLKIKTEVVANETKVDAILQAANEAVEETNKKIKKTKKEKVEAPTEPTEPAVEAAPPLTAVKETKDQAVSALSAVNAKLGIDAARTVLAQFGIKRLGELEPIKYSDFIRHCEAL